MPCREAHLNGSVVTPTWLPMQIVAEEGCEGGTGQGKQGPPESTVQQSLWVVTSPSEQL